MTASPGNSKRPRRWFQFSLRSLGLLIALCCMGLALERNAVRSRLTSIAEIEKLGGVITFDESRRFRPSWIESLGRERISAEVIGINLNGRLVSDESMAHLTGFTKLEKLDLSRTSVSDAGLAKLRSLTNLRELRLWESKLTGEGLSHLQSTSLDTLYVSGERLKNIELLSMPQLRSVYLGDGLESNMTCTCHDCPVLDRLDIRGEVTTFDLRNLPLLLELHYEPSSDLDDNLLDSDVAVTLHGAPGLHSLNIGRVRTLSLDFEDAANLKWIRLVARSFAKVRIADVPLLADLDEDRSKLGEPRTSDGYLTFNRASKDAY